MTSLAQTSQQQPDEAQIMDRIDIRYDVKGLIEVAFLRHFFAVTAGFSIVCGVYSGVPSKATLAELINNRRVHPDDISEVTVVGLNEETLAIDINDIGTMGLSVQALVDLINAKGVTEDDIESITISEVLLDEKVIAQTT